MPWLLYLTHLQLILMPGLIGNTFFLYLLSGYCFTCKFHFCYEISFIFVLLPHRELMNLILEKGHSRVPVYYEQPTNIIGLILVFALYSSVTFWDYLFNHAQRCILSNIVVSLFCGTFWSKEWPEKFFWHPFRWVNICLPHPSPIHMLYEWYLFVLGL